MFHSHGLAFEPSTCADVIVWAWARSKSLAWPPRGVCRGWRERGHEASATLTLTVVDVSVQSV